MRRPGRRSLQSVGLLPASRPPRDRLDAHSGSRPRGPPGQKANLIRVLEATLKHPRRGPRHPALFRPPTIKVDRRRRATRGTFSALNARPTRASDALMKLPSARLDRPDTDRLSLDPPSILVGFTGSWSDLDLLTWAWVSRRSVRLFHCRSPVGPGRAVVGQAATGGPQVASNSRVQAVSHGQSRGRCSRSRRAERAIRAGTAISWLRMVAVVALAWAAEASALAARMRLNAIVASTSQAEFAANDPDGRWASGPALRSAWTCSMIACCRWVASAASVGSGESVNTAWCR